MPRGLLFEPRYRNRTEKAVGTQLEKAGVPFAYEGRKIPYEVPARTAKYLPDFLVGDASIDIVRGAPNIILEVKGWFGRNGAKERQKMVLLKEQYPHLDFRLVFTDASKKLYKGSKTTYAMWADENGFKWCDKATIPASWLREMKRSIPKRKK